MKDTKRNWRSPLLLLLTATIWGVAFVAQSVGMDYVKPFTFNGVRSLLGAAVLVPLIFLLGHRKDERIDAADSPKKGAKDSEGKDE